MDHHPSQPRQFGLAGIILITILYAFCKVYDSINNTLLRIEYGIGGYLCHLLKRLTTRIPRPHGVYVVVIHDYTKAVEGHLVLGAFEDEGDARSVLRRVLNEQYQGVAVFEHGGQVALRVDGTSLIGVVTTIKRTSVKRRRSSWLRSWVEWVCWVVTGLRDDE